MWSRWKMGQSLLRLGAPSARAMCQFSLCCRGNGGIVPAARRRSLLTHTLTEREDISRGIASGWSIRDIARGLERAVSTMSREVARHGGRPQYRANEADHGPGSRPCGQGVPLAIHVKLQKIVASKLILDWSPEQISGWLKMQNPETRVCPRCLITLHRSCRAQWSVILDSWILLLCHENFTFVRFCSHVHVWGKPCD